MNQVAKAAEIKTQVFEKLGHIAACLGSPARLKLVQLLAQSPKTVEELSQISGESIANTSQHLQRLAKEGLVFATRDGLKRIYQVKSPQVVALWESIQELGHELAPELNEAENKLTDASLRSPIALSKVLEEVRAEKAVLLDVRETKEVGATPVRRSVAIPLKELEKACSKLPRKKTIYVFCRGRYCSMATDAVRKLRAKGFKSFRLRESSFVISRSSS